MGELEATDMFCGAGGSSLGLEFVCCPACGRSLIRVTQAINHWDLAVQAHNANFPHADHDVHDVEDVPAKRFRRTDLFWASPECVNHTSCKGKRDDSPEAQRSRATFKDIVRFTHHHKYDAVIVENVIEARLWCEHEDCACGAEFEAWYRAMEAEGYVGQIVYFNSQFALPTPQSRDRMYIVFTREGLEKPNLNFRPLSWCTTCLDVVHGIQKWKKPSRGSSRERVPHWGRYGAQYVYTCEHCHQAVAPAVLGARTIIDWKLPIQRIGDRKYKNGKRRDLAPNTRRRIRVGWQNINEKRPMVVQVGGHLFERDGYARVWSLDAPLHTVTKTSTSALVLPQRDGAVGKPVEQPMDSVTTRSQLALITRVGGVSKDPQGRSADEPLSTIVTSDRQVGLVVPNMTNCVPNSSEEPLGAVTTGNRHMLVQTTRGTKNGNDDSAHRTKHMGEPLGAIAGHGEFGLVEFRGDHGTTRDGDLPAHTITAQGTHHGMIVYNGMPGFVRSLDDAAGTITARDKQSLLVPYYTNGKAHPVGTPMSTVSTHDREALVITEQDIDDCYFRMLQWTELLRAQMMHVRPGGEPYELTAMRRNGRGKIVELSNELRTKMIGNAVSSPVATMLGHAVMEVLR